MAYKFVDVIYYFDLLHGPVRLLQLTLKWFAVFAKSTIVTSVTLEVFSGPRGVFYEKFKEFIHPNLNPPRCKLARSLKKMNNSSMAQYIADTFSI